MKRPSSIKGICLYLFGLFLCTGPVMIAVLAYFPLWRESGGGKVISGGALLLLIAAWVPVTKLLRRIFSSPASYTMWLVIFLVFFALSAIAEQVKVISFVGFMGNALGALCFKACGSKRMGGENEK